jgi:hypothetical protein
MSDNFACFPLHPIPFSSVFTSLLGLAKKGSGGFDGFGQIMFAYKVRERKRMQVKVKDMELGRRVELKLNQEEGEGEGLFWDTGSSEKRQKILNCREQVWN